MSEEKILGPIDIANFQAIGLGVVIEDSRLGGKIAIVRDEAAAEHFPDCACYTAEEMLFMFSLSNEMAKGLHMLKRKFGGTVGPLASDEALEEWAATLKDKK
jgi:hypothetical protein